MRAPGIATTCATSGSRLSGTTPAPTATAIRGSLLTRTAPSAWSHRTRQATTTMRRWWAAGPSSTAGWPGGSCPTISGWRAGTACRRARRWPTGRSATRTSRPFYERAEWEIGVSGDGTRPIQQGARARGYPMPPVRDRSRGGAAAGAARRRSASAPYVPPLLINTVPRAGRGACIQCGSCVGFPCPSDAKNGVQNTMLPRALAHRRLRPGDRRDGGSRGHRRRRQRHRRALPGTRRRWRDAARAARRRASSC